MINIFLILLIIHVFGFLIFKPKNAVLSCGIFGWAGKDPKKFNKDKFDKLGIFNVDRGKSSCGVSYDGDVFIGLNMRKLYCDFIIDEEIKPVKFPVVIGHTRQASVGTTVNLHNAHPFAFGKDDGQYEFIGCHNGTLYNKEELAETFKVNSKENTTRWNNVAQDFEKDERNKIDSEVLLESIYLSKNFKVLSDYLGAAALMFTDLTEPNVVYLFRGESKIHSYSKTTEGERPLFVYVENKNSMYVSSLENSLRTIGGNDDNIFELETNIVFKITDGDFKKAERFDISRANAQQTTRSINGASSYPNSRYIGYGGYEWSDEFDSSDFIDCREKKPNEASLLPQNITKKRVVRKDEEREARKDEINIYTETLSKPQTEYGDRVYFHKFRFRRNGHPITGIYTWVMGYGYYPLGHTIRNAEENFWFKVDKPFVEGAFRTELETLNDFVPFKKEKIIEPGLFYFVEGVQIRTALDYAQMYRKWGDLSKGDWLDFIDLSHVSSHPIINMTHKYKDADAQCITLNGKVFSGKITPLGSEKNYEIEKGNLIKITDSNYYKLIKSREEESKPQLNFAFKDSDIINKAMKVGNEDFISSSCGMMKEEIIEQNDEELLNNMIKTEEEETELVLEIANEELAEPLQDMQKTRDKLLPYNHNNVAIKIISFIDNTLGKINEIIKS